MAAGRQLIVRYMPDGTIRAVWTDQRSDLYRRHGYKPRRASRIEVVDGGPFDGHFFVDMSLLAEWTGQRHHLVCLWPPRQRYDDAIADELQYLRDTYLGSTP